VQQNIGDYRNTFTQHVLLYLALFSIAKYFDVMITYPDMKNREFEGGYMVDVPMNDETTAVSLEDKYKAIVRLTRWREHVPFTVPLVIIGAMMAATTNNVSLDNRLIAVIFANIFAMCFAFMINDVEDAPDDALNPKKRAHNVISSGILTPREGAIASWSTFIVSAILYAIGGTWAFILGMATLILCYLYSAHPFRLKARPITDVVSHVLMLSGLLVMTGYFTYGTDPQAAWYVIVAAILFSAYGQFYNQVDDYEVDKEAGLKNTVVLLGKYPTMALMYLSMVGAVICMFLATQANVFPEWLGTVLVLSAVASALFPWELDMRGNRAEGTGNIQRPSLLVANMVALFWMAQYVGWLSF